MYDYKEKLPENSFFAAANSFSGFKSIFDSVFDRRNTTRTFIIKGGPGTGKSTILKKLCDFGKEQNLYHEALFCSSDPYSLDGVILSNGRCSVAFLDGTSPHEQDANYPGAFDEIVNLGESFDFEALSSSKDIILSLNSKKKEAYRNAYSLLKIAGEINSHLRYIFNCNMNETVIRNAAKSIVDNIQYDEKGKRKKRYISSFGRYGYKRINAYYTEKNKLSIKGDGHTEFYLMQFIYPLIKEKIDIVFPSPLNENDIEAYALGNTFILTGCENGLDVSNYNILESNAIKCLIEEEKHFLNLSKESFNEAALHHFALEAIYKDSVSFENNNRILQKLKTDALFWLGQ